VIALVPFVVMPVKPFDQSTVTPALSAGVWNPFDPP
jgi:hypothetical protein